MEFHQLTDAEKNQARMLAGHLAMHCFQYSQNRGIHLAGAIWLVQIVCVSSCEDPAGQLDLIADHLMQEAAKMRDHIIEAKKNG